MKAIVLNNHLVEYLELSLTPLPYQWAKIKVDSVGLCGTDVAKIIAPSLALNHTKILGHEFIGRVVEINGLSAEINDGDRVVCMPVISCGNCDACIHHKENLCVKADAIGRTIQGAFAEFVNVPIENLVKVTNESFYDSFVLADTLAVCVHAINLSRKIASGAESLVIGDGAIGCLLTWLLLKERRRVSIKGIHSENLHFMVKFGANALNENIQLRFYDEVYETVGRYQSNTLDIALNAVKAGGSIVVLGVYAPGYNYSLIVRELFIKEAVLLGANAYTREEFIKAVRLINEYKEELGAFLSHTFSLSQFSDALEAAKNKKGFTMKIVLKPWGIL